MTRHSCANRIHQHFQGDIRVMAFDKNIPINQGAGPFCGAACAVYVLHWLKNLGIAEGAADGTADDLQLEIRHAMDQTCTSSCTDNLGSTPANIATYLKQHEPTVKIYAPTEIITNWSMRPWYMGLRAGLQTCSGLEWSCGCDCALPGGVLGDDYMIISMISESWTLPFVTAAYYNAHFVVHIGNDLLMDPNGVIRNATTFLSGGYLSRGWASVGLDLHVFKEPII